ncbi:MAG: hypothetical protein DRI24_23825, partial [Deltaproteobacteria bacterium]
MKRKKPIIHLAGIQIGVCSGIVILILLAYLPTFSGDFLLDDHPLIADNPLIRDLQPLPWYFLQEDGVLSKTEVAGGYHTGYYRPLISLTYQLDYKLWGLAPMGFRLTNLILHLAVCLMLYLILKAHQTGIFVSFAVVAFFGLHPVNTEAVSWISSRNNILVALFSLAGYYFYTTPGRARPLINRGLSVLFFAAALFSKEFAIMLLPILFLYNRFRKGKPMSRAGEWLGYLPFVAVLTVYLYLRHQALGGEGMSPAHSLLFRLFATPFIILYYLRLLVFPVGLHNFYVSYPEQILSAEILIGICGLLLVTFLIFRSPRGSRLRWGAVVFILGLAPVLNIVQTASPSLVSMRWAYFPFVFLCTVFAGLGFGRSGASRVWWAVPILFGLWLGGYTHYLNSRHWQNNAVLFKREVALHANAYYYGGLAET